MPTVIVKMTRATLEAADLVVVLSDADAARLQELPAPNRAFWAEQMVKLSLEGSVMKWKNKRTDYGVASFDVKWD